jgi:ubiquinone/menaquinone biosynthesis C-methylase UbiE
MGDDATAFTGEVPRFYDEGMGPVLFEPMAGELATRVAAGAPSRVLEVAAGTGISSRALAGALPEAELVVTDLNEPMLTIAAAKLPPGTTVQVADAQALPFPDASFDAVACQFGVMFLPDLALGLREARRVTRPGGRYVLSTWDHPHHNPYAEISHALLVEAFPDDTPPFYRIPYGSGDVERLRQALHAAGFARVTVDVVPHASPVARWEDFVAGFTQGNPLGAMVRQRGGDLPALQAAMVAAYVDAFGPAPATLPIQALFLTCS